MLTEPPPKFYGTRDILPTSSLVNQSEICSRFEFAEYLSDASGLKSALALGTPKMRPAIPAIDANATM